MDACCYSRAWIVRSDVRAETQPRDGRWRLLGLMTVNGSQAGESVECRLGETEDGPGEWRAGRWPGSADGTSGRLGKRWPSVVRRRGWRGTGINWHAHTSPLAGRSRRLPNPASACMRVCSLCIQLVCIAYTPHRDIHTVSHPPLSCAFACPLFPPAPLLTLACCFRRICL